MKRLFWMPGDPGTLHSPPYEIEQSDEILSIVTIRKNGRWMCYCRSVREAKAWCRRDTAMGHATTLALGACAIAFAWLLWGVS